MEYIFFEWKKFAWKCGQNYLATSEADTGKTPKLLPPNK